MSSLDKRKELKHIAEILVKDEIDFYDIKQATDNLYNLFLELVDFDINNETRDSDVYLSSGKAIAPYWAAMCINDFMRTKKFILGTYEAIKSVVDNNPDRKVSILYAGTGPFATICIPLTTLFSSKEISITFLEINPIAIKYLKEVITELNIEEYVEDIIECDASAIKFENNKKFDLIISETMQNALKKEPQVEIFLNLVKYLKDDGILIPENITVDFGTLDSRLRMKQLLGEDESGINPISRIKNLLNLNKELLLETLQGNGNRVDISFPETELTLHHTETADRLNYHLFTTITVYADIILSDWECSLNLPYPLKNLDKKISNTDHLVFQYQTGETPGFDYRLPDKAAKE